MKKIEITKKQAEQFNWMLIALKRIKAYQKPRQIQKDSKNLYGIGYAEALEMAYENMQGEANACKGVKPIDWAVEPKCQAEVKNVKLITSPSEEATNKLLSELG